MDKPLFREGGPYNIRNEGQDTFSMHIPVPADEDSLVGRKCPNDGCSPAYFRIKLGTGIVDEGCETAFCPYCRNEGNQSEFATDEQTRYAKDTFGREAAKAVERRLSDELGLDRLGRKTIDAGLLSFEFSVKSSGGRPVRLPMDDRQRRDIVCPHCGLEHTVYGLAFWCPDCGKDVFLTHVEAELKVVEWMLSDVERRRELFGDRVAAKDLENCMEDVVSIFEAVLKLMARRALENRGAAANQTKAFLSKLRNKLQNPEVARSVFDEEFAIDLFEEIDTAIANRLTAAFAKRHPITHNLGIVDRKYIERSADPAKEGTEVAVASKEIAEAIGFIKRVLRSTWKQVADLTDENSAQ
jgi:hypothetical protein